MLPNKNLLYVITLLCTINLHSMQQQKSPITAIACSPICDTLAVARANATVEFRTTQDPENINFTMQLPGDAVNLISLCPLPITHNRQDLRLVVTQQPAADCHLLRFCLLNNTNKTTIDQDISKTFPTIVLNNSPAASLHYWQNAGVLCFYITQQNESKVQYYFNFSQNPIEVREWNTTPTDLYTLFSIWHKNKAIYNKLKHSLQISTLTEEQKYRYKPYVITSSKPIQLASFSWNEKLLAIIAPNPPAEIQSTTLGGKRITQWHNTHHKVSIWDVASGEVRITLNYNGDLKIISLAFSQDDSKIFLLLENGEPLLFTIPTPTATTPAATETPISTDSQERIDRIMETKRQNDQAFLGSVKDLTKPQPSILGEFVSLVAALAQLAYQSRHNFFPFIYQHKGTLAACALFMVLYKYR